MTRNPRSRSAKCALKQVSSDNGFLRVYTYDSLGRVSSETSSIDTTYNVSKTYDAYGRVSVLTYPTGVAVKNVYNAYGYLAEVRNNASNALFWKGNAKDAEGHVLNEALGNGLTTTRTYTATTGRVASIAVGPNGSIQNQSFMFDSLGNLIYRYDPAQAQSETFSYDGLNRLITTTKGATTTTVAYDSIGNITNKSDVGDYTYGAKPHAVAQVTGTINATYAYDPNGNLTSGAGRSVTYTSYNQPSQITTGTASVNFLYDADHTRIKQISTSETIIYLNPRIDAGMHFEKEVKGRVTEYKHYLYGAGGVVGVYTTSSAASPKTSYFHQDHLGSIVAVTDDAAVVVARYAFDPWGKRLVLAGDAEATHHGFTGHEHLSDVGLVHMNGRIYDPILARFMSADPYIQAPDNLQSYNRYSYVWNNPLSATDPSGYKIKWGKVFKIAAVVVAAYFLGPAVYNNVFWGLAQSTSLGVVGGGIIAGAAAGAAVGAISGAVMGGNFQSAFKGAVFGAISGGIYGGVDSYFGDKWSWQRVGANSFAGGVSSEIQGGRFKDGFKLNFMSGAARMGWEYAREATDGMKLKSVTQSDGLDFAKYNSSGELLTDGTRFSELVPGAQPYEQSRMMSALSMAREGSGQHLYDENGLVGRFVNKVSKIHDWFNSWNYNSESGRYISRGKMFDTAFDALWSFPGMPVAGAFTGVAMASELSPYLYQMYTPKRR